MISAHDALERLRQGNLRFAANLRREDMFLTDTRRKLVSAQHPFAIVLGCCDSRVPAEIIFDQGLGDLYVVRVAGNIVAPSQIASVEFAVEQFGTRAVVVLGHSRCGAVLATIEELRRPPAEQSPNLHAIVQRIRPAVEPLLSPEGSRDEQTLVEEAVRANIRASVEQLRHGSELLDQLSRTDGLLVIGAEYSLETGVVSFFWDSGSVQERFRPRSDRA